MLRALEELMPNLPHLVIIKIIESIVEEVENDPTISKDFKCFDIDSEEMLEVVQDLYVATKTISEFFKAYTL